MTVRTVKLGGTDWSDGQVLYAADLNDTIGANDGALGEVRMFALSMSGAVTKAALQTRGWAICDGTTPASQGISSPTIATTPDLQEKFLRMSNDESSGGTGGADTVDLSHTHTIPSGGYGDGGAGSNGELCIWKNEAAAAVAPSLNPASSSSLSSTQSILPAYYEVAYFMRVK